MFEEDVGVVACDKLVGNDDEFGVVLDVGSVDRLVVGRNRLLNLLQGVIQTVLEEVPNLILLLVEDFLQALQEGLDFLAGSVQPLLEHVDGSLLLLVALIQLTQTSFGEEFLTD